MRFVYIFLLSIFTTGSFSQEIPPEIPGASDIKHYTFDDIPLGEINLYGEQSYHDLEFTPSLINGYYPTIAPTCSHLPGADYYYENVPSPPAFLMVTHSHEIIFSRPVNMLTFRYGYFSPTSEFSPLHIQALSESGDVIDEVTNISPLLWGGEFSPCGQNSDAHYDLSAMTLIALQAPINGPSISRIRFIEPGGSYSSIGAIDNLIVDSSASDDFSISEIRIGQTVYNPDFIPTQKIHPEALDSPTDGIFDLVASKSAKLLIGLSSSFSEQKSVNAKLQIRNSSGEIAHEEVLSVSIPSMATVEINFDLPTTTPGNYSFNLLIDPENLVEESNEENNSPPQVSNYIVHKTNDLSIGFVPINACQEVVSDPSDPDETITTPCYESTSLSDVQALATPQVRSHLIDVFPVSNTGVSFNTGHEEMVEGEPSRMIGALGWGIKVDIANLTKLRNELQVRKVIGVFGDGYAEYHGRPSGLQGIVLNSQSLSAALVRKGADRSVAHELSHAMGQWKEMYGRDALNKWWDDYSHFKVGWNRAGYDAIGSIKITGANALTASFSAGPISNRWADPNTYYKNFQTLLSPLVDPERIEIAGILHKNGQFDVLSVEEFQDGLITASEEDGTLSARVIGTTGEPLQEVRIKPGFTAFIDGIDEASTQVIELSSTPVVISMPKPANSSQIELFYNGATVFTKDVPSRISAIEIINQIDHSLVKGFWLLKYLRIYLLKQMASYIDVNITQKRYKTALIFARRLRSLLSSSLTNREAREGFIGRKESISKIKELHKEIESESKKKRPSNSKSYNGKHKKNRR